MDPFQSVHVDDFDVLEFRQRFLLDSLGDDSRERLGAPFVVLFVGVFGGQQPLANADGLVLLFGRQAPISAAHGEPRWFSDRRHPEDFHLHVQVGHHPTDNGQLLKVFFAKDGNVRVHGVEEFCDDGGDALEMAWSVFALETGSENPRFHVRLKKWLWVHGSRSGRVDGVDSSVFLAEGNVVVDGTRVGVEVGLGIELERVDKDGDDDVV